jgi:hypothetical protein
MRRQPDTISLGGRSFEVRPLTVAQVQAIEPLLVGSESSAATIATAVAILRVALARDHAEAAAELDTLEAGAPEIGAAMAQVLRLGGFLPGEAQAGGGNPPPPASTGADSTPG